MTLDSVEVESFISLITPVAVDDGHALVITVVVVSVSKAGIVVTTTAVFAIVDAVMLSFVPNG
jgi:folylpolyglutamate synthase/dihydropteroate synthase